jgi:hydroxypyruvate reductase
MRSLEALRLDARAIFDAGVTAADPYRAVARHVSVEQGALLVSDKAYQLQDYQRIVVVGAGKASARMAQALEDLLGNRISCGIINVKHRYSVPLAGISVNEASHPLPDEAGLRGARAIADLARQANNGDLVFCLISGGGSALLPAPADGVTLEEKVRTTRLLLDCGATVQEMNAVRKHISNLKGGRLADLAFPATVISLILSDVVGDPPDAIASGPTAADETTFADCLRIVQKYHLETRIPPAVWRLLQRGASGALKETPKAGDPVFARVQNLIVGNNRSALDAARKTAESLGYRTLLLSSFIEGETRVVAALHGAIAKEIIASGNPVQRPACVISGGETTVTVRGTGLGGRNQEFALAAALDIAGAGNVAILSGGTDGSDGPTDAAGALADGTTVSRAKALGLNAQVFLDENDSYHFFKQMGDLLITGPTFTNVMDLRVLVAD